MGLTNHGQARLILSESILLYRERNKGGKDIGYNKLC